MKVLKKVTGIILAVALVVTSVNVSFAPKNVKAADVDPVTDLKVYNYCDWTGKYFIYFTPPANAEGYRVYVDDGPIVARLKGSGEYITNDDLSQVSAGTHQLKVEAYATVGGITKNSTKTSVKFTKSDQVGTFTDIPQIYIRSGSISSDYRFYDDVSIAVVDQDGGSKGLGCIDDEGAHKDKATTTKYSDIIDTNSNIKIRGNTTSTQPKKAYNVKFSGKTSVLGLPKGKKWCLLANSMDKSLMRDTLSYNFGLENGVKYTSQSRYVDVYLNGEYKGNYQLCEPVEAKSNRVEVDAYNAANTDILLEYGTRNEADVDHFTTDIYNQTFDVNDPEKGDDLTDEEVDAKINRARNYLTSFETVLRGNVNNLEILSRYIDVDSFVDYYIANELFKNVDFNFSSTRFYIKDNKLYAGPMWDLDLSSGNCKSTYYTSYYEDGDSSKGYYCRGIKYYERLFKNEEFVNLVKQRYYDLQYKIQSLYRDDSTEVNSIKYIVNRYGNSFQRNYMSKDNGGAGWQLRNEDGYSFAAESTWYSWEDPINFLKDWMIRRNNWLCGQWDIDQDEAYAKGKEAAEPTTTPAPTTTIAPTTTPEPTKAPTLAPTNNKTKGKQAAPARRSIKPGPVTVIKAKKSAKKLKVTLKRLDNVSGYQIAVYKKKKNAKANKKAIRKTYTIMLTTKIKSKKFKRKKLYVRARAYAILRGKVYYGAWGPIKKVK